MENKRPEFQAALDQHARYCLMALPDPARPNEPNRQSGYPADILFRGTLHRFDISSAGAAGEPHQGITNRVDEFGAPFQFRCSPIPASYVPKPGERPPAERWEVGQSQRLAATEVEFTIGQDSRNRVRGIGAGRTYPIFGMREPRIRIALNGVFHSASGAFAGKLGMFTITGLFKLPDSFQLSVLVLIANPGPLVTRDPAPEIECAKKLDLEATYLLAGTYVPSFTSTHFQPPGVLPPARLEVNERIRRYTTRFSTSAIPSCWYEYGEDIGEHDVFLDFQQTTPSAASDVERFSFTTQERGPVGSLHLTTDEIRSQILPVTGIPDALQPQAFAGFGSMDWGDGCFAGVQGFQTNVGLGTVLPHLTSITSLFELAGPAVRPRA